MKIPSLVLLVMVLGGIVAGCSPKAAEPEKAAPAAGSAAGTAGAAAPSQNGGAAFGPDGKPLPK